MKINIISKRACWCGTLTGVFVALIIPLSAPLKVELQVSPLLFAEEKASVGVESVSVPSPIHLLIPKIKVDARVESLGLTKGGAVAVPKGPESVAWYNLGARPGEVGNSVISGHSGWKNHIPAVFDRLQDVRVGDKLSVENETGEVITFVVREIRLYGEGDTALDIFTSKDGKAHLVLITCAGKWNKVTQSYPNRLVVFADRELTSE